MDDWRHTACRELPERLQSFTSPWLWWFYSPLGSCIMRKKWSQICGLVWYHWSYFFHSNIAATWTKVRSLIRAVVYFQTGRTDKAVDTLRVAQGLGMISTAELVDSLDIFPGQIVGSYFDQDKWLTCLLKSIILPENVIVWIRFVHWTGLGVLFVYSTGYI